MPVPIQNSIRGDFPVPYTVHHSTTSKITRLYHLLSKWPSLSTDLIYWADVVSYPRHPEVTPSQSYWHTDGQSGLIQKQQHKQQQQQQQTKQQTIAKPFQNLSGLGFDWLQF